ncbi:MAG: adenine deaminase [Erysipelotrichaceae bacterium]
MEKERLRRLKNAAAGLEPLDLLIEDVRVVNVFTQEVHDAHLGIKDGYIVSFQKQPAKQVISGNHAFVAPTMMDPHMHLESTMLQPHLLSDILVPRGVSGVVADPHELVNACGAKGLDFILEASEALPLEVYVSLPSCVPSTPFETAFGEFTPADIKPYYQHPRVVGLAEVMSYEAVLHDDAMLEKLSDAMLANKQIDGHGAVLDNQGLDVYATCQIRNDHECMDAQEMVERLRRGIYTFMREGSAAKNLDDLLPGITPHNFRYACFCSDDRHPDDLVREGSMDYVVNLAIAKGLDPIMALTMASHNVAMCYGLPHLGAVAPGYRANFFLFDDLQNILATSVYLDGALVARDQVMLTPSKKPSTTSEAVLASMHVKQVNPQLFELHVPSEKANVMQVSYGTLTTQLQQVVVTCDEQQRFVFDEQDLAKLFVVERHHATGNVGKSLAMGFQLEQGAIATSVAHDSHNILVLGKNDADMQRAVEHIIAMGGGYVVVANGEVLADVPLPIGGLMSLEDTSTLVKQMDALHQAMHQLMPKTTFNPFMMLSFMALPVIPAYKVTDLGFFDVMKQKLVSVDAGEMNV